MIRAPGRTPAPPDDHGTRNVLVMVGLGVILLFALVGVVSAGIFLGSKVAGSSGSGKVRATATATTSRVAVQDVARAQAQATQIVRTAQRTGRTIVSRATKSARRQSAVIVAAAQKQAATVRRAAQAAAVPAPTAPPAVASSPPQSGSVSSATGPGLAPTAGIGAVSTSATSTTSPPARLSGFPASWLVVAYNASFGSGPGSAGSISVISRSKGTLSGVARVVYRRGGVASALFSGLAPGQSLILPLNGPRYSGGGYSIQVVNVR